VSIKLSRRYKVYQDSIRRRHLKRLEHSDNNQLQMNHILPHVGQSTGRYSQIKSIELSDLRHSERIPSLFETKLGYRKHHRANNKT
jgi:hypothetical protein